jgi:DNA-binding NarL/FixJ family response regulator
MLTRAISLLDLSLDKEKYDMAGGILRIFLVDDHDVVLEGLQGIICAEADMMVAGTAMNGTFLIEKIAAAKADLVLLDIQIAHFDVFQVVAEIQDVAKCSGSISPGIIFVTGFADAYIATRAYKLGVRGYLLKEEALSQSLPGAIRLVANGGFAYSGKVQKMLYNPRTLPQGLSFGGEQYNVLALMVNGYTAGQIAHELGLTLYSVYTIQKRIRKKLQAESNTQAVSKALEQNIVHLHVGN